MSTVRFLIAGLVAAAPAGAQAQALRCAIPRILAAPQSDLPTVAQPARNLPIGGYTLAVTWGPQQCRDHGREPATQIQCGAGNRFGFTLHGLWPDGEGATWPQYCGAAALLDRTVLRANLCATPSVQLLQHEWSKHGTCMNETPTGYFAKARKLYEPVRYPDMIALSRRSLTAQRLASAIARANTGMRADMMRITAKRGGWLDEIWFCLDKAMRYRTCPSHQGGVARSSRIRIWRGRR